MPSPKYQVYNLEETYPELGEYTFKIVLNPRFFKSGHGFRVVLQDSDRKPMKHSAEVWGRKINVKFDITPETADGVAQATVYRESTLICQLQFWIIKP